MMSKTYAYHCPSNGNSGLVGGFWVAASFAPPYDSTWTPPKTVPGVPDTGNHDKRASIHSQAAEGQDRLTGGQSPAYRPYFARSIVTPWSYMTGIGTNID